ncbi:hypothetical protein HH299_18950, partial [Xanthomonas sp. Kuri4-2]
TWSGHRAIAVADSARRLLPRTVGLLSAQDVLTVPDLHSKYLLQLAGLGYGFLPEPYARGALAEGSLVALEVDSRKPDETFWLAWRPDEEGEALAWWRRAARREGLFAQWCERIAATYRSGESLLRTREDVAQGG